MESAPEVVPITDLRRDAAGIIGRAVASGTPVYVTQHSRVTAVLLPEQAYRNLLHRVRVLEVAKQEGIEAADEGRTDEGRAGEGRAGEGRADASQAPEAGRRRLDDPIRYSSTLVRTRFGLTDPETAAFLIEEGYGVRTSGVGVSDADATDVGAGEYAGGGFSAGWYAVDEDQAG